jgi:hypothetical protein
LDFIQGKKHAELPERLVRAPRQIEKGGMSAVYYVYIMVAWDKRHAGSQLGMISKEIKELRPLAPRSGIGNIARNQHSIDRTRGVNCRQISQGAPHALVALGT